MSVRATNVYEERSLGVFNDDDDSEAGEDMERQAGSRVVGWSKYIAFHARRQLAFDIWWLGKMFFLSLVLLAYSFLASCLYFNASLHFSPLQVWRSGSYASSNVPNSTIARTRPTSTSSPSSSRLFLHMERSGFHLVSLMYVSHHAHSLSSFLLL